MNKTFQQSLLIAMMMALTGLIFNGFTAESLRYVALPNLVITFIFAYFSIWVVDKMYGGKK